MSGAVLVTSRVDPPERIRQCAEIYARAGLDTDILAEGGSAVDSLPARRLAVWRTEAQIPALLHQLHRETEADLIHFAAGIPPAVWPLRPGETLGVVDCNLPRSQGALRSGRLDMLLAEIEADRRAMTQMSVEAIRLPVRLPVTPGRRLGRKAVIGGWGHWDADLVEGWDRLCSALTDAAILPGARLLLAGPGAEGVRLSSCPMTVIRRAGAGPSALRTLDVMVVPASASPQRRSEVVAALARGCPVLAIEPLAKLFEHRWHLPQPGDHGGLARWLGRALPLWQDSPPSDLGHRLERTRQAFLDDQAAMEAHVASRIRARLAEV